MSTTQTSTTQKLSPELQQDIDLLSIDTIRTLAIDGVQKANSGHPGAPMGLAPVVYALWQNYLRYDPADPLWPNRDRFVLSNGHASMLLYSMLHLTGVKRADADDKITDKPAVSMEDLKSFRQLDSVTPGHPESHMTTGIETTTGPLGQGIANSVGMAIASKWLGANYNRPGLRHFRLQRLRGVRRRRHDGRRRQRSSISRRTFKTFESLLDLRSQQHNARRAGEMVVRRRCDDEICRAGLERYARLRCERSDDARPSRTRRS